MAPRLVLHAPQVVVLRTPVDNIEYFPPNFEGLVLGCIRIRIRSRLVFEKKENLGVCAKQKVRLTRLGKYYVVQYCTLSMPIFSTEQ